MVWRAVSTCSYTGMLYDSGMSLVMDARKASITYKSDSGAGVTAAEPGSKEADRKRCLSRSDSQCALVLVISEHAE